MRLRYIGTLGGLTLAFAAMAAVLLGSDRRSATADPPRSGDEVRVSGPAVILDAPWGAGPGQLGRDDGNESSPEGPMSFVVSPFDEIFVLDQVNQRIARFEANGPYRGALPLPATTFQGLGLTADGVLVALDRLARRSLLLMTLDGRVLDELPFVGEAIPEGGAVTAMFVEPDGVWLEVGHSYRVRVLDDALLPVSATRPVRAGRRSGAHGVEAVAALDGRGGAALWLQDAQDATIYAQRELAFSQDVARIAWLAADARDRLVMALHLWTWSATDPRRVAHEQNLVMVFDRYLGRLARFSVPWVVTRWEQFREFTVSPQGAVCQMTFSPQGVRIRRWRMSW